MTTESAPSVPGTHYRIQPSVGVGIVVVLVYMAVSFGIQASSGIEYKDWFLNADNAYRAAVLPLVVCSVLLILFLLVARWDMVWRDPGRLTMSVLMKAALILFVVAILLRCAGIRWSDLPSDLVLAVAASSVLVGFAEETLFRGIFLRCLRTNGRAEGIAALWTAIGFGLFHLPNVFLGTGPGGLLQILLAALSGGTLYLIRRQFGFIIPAMIAHGIWDFSTFLDANFGTQLITLLSLVVTIVIAVIALIVLIQLARKEHVAVTPRGIIGASPQPAV